MSVTFLKNKELPKETQIFHILNRPLFQNGWPYRSECWRVLRDFCGFSKKCGFATFPEM